MFSESVLLVDDNSRFLQMLSKRFLGAGFSNILCAVDIKTANVLLTMQKIDLMLVDIHFEDELSDGINFLVKAKQNGFTGRAIVISSDRSVDQFFRAAKAGAEDFLIKDTKVDFVCEVIRLINGERGVTQERENKQVVSELGYLRCFGLTPKEISVLTEYAVDFPRLGILAERIEQAPVQLRKVFSRMYKKLDVDNIGQLARILVICELFSTDN